MREILEHVGRMLELLKIQQRGDADDTRIRIFIRRLIELESEVRRACRGAGR